MIEKENSLPAACLFITAFYVSIKQRRRYNGRAALKPDVCKISELLLFEINHEQEKRREMSAHKKCFQQTLSLEMPEK